jgi:hypothetical protein
LLQWLSQSSLWFSILLSLLKLFAFQLSQMVGSSKELEVLLLMMMMMNCLKNLMACLAELLTSLLKVPSAS